MPSESQSAVSDSLQPQRPHSPRDSPGQNTGVGSLSLLQGIFPTQESNPGFPHCRRILYQLSHKRSPRTLEWVAYPFSSRSSWPRNQIGVSCISDGFLPAEVSGKPVGLQRVWQAWVINSFTFILRKIMAKLYDLVLFAFKWINHIIILYNYYWK